MDTTKYCLLNDHFVSDLDWLLTGHHYESISTLQRENLEVVEKSNEIKRKTNLDWKEIGWFLDRCTYGGTCFQITFLNILFKGWNNSKIMNWTNWMRVQLKFDYMHYSNSDSNMMEFIDSDSDFRKIQTWGKFRSRKKNSKLERLRDSRSNKQGKKNVFQKVQLPLTILEVFLSGTVLTFHSLHVVVERNHYELSNILANGPDFYLRQTSCRPNSNLCNTVTNTKWEERERERQLLREKEKERETFSDRTQFDVMVKKILTFSRLSCALERILSIASLARNAFLELIFL